MKIDLGPEIVGLLLPHKRPFLMVDRIVEIGDKPTPSLHARRLITQNESIFDGHFPGWPLWPGALTIEALAQAANLLLVLAEMRAESEDILNDLRQLSLSMRMEPVATPGPEVLARLRSPGPSGVLSAVDVKLKRPVFAGTVLDLHVREDGRFQDLIHLHVEAVVDRRVVADGSLHVARRSPPI